MKGGQNRREAFSESSGRDGVWRSEEDPGGDRFVEIDPGRTGSMGSRILDGDITRIPRRITKDQEIEDLGKIISKDPGREIPEGNHEEKDLLNRPANSRHPGTIWR